MEKIKKGDKVIVLSGNFKNLKGEVLKVFPKKKALVKGINLIKKHLKINSTNKKSGIIEKESLIHLSKVSIIDPNNNKNTRIGFIIKEGKKFRITKKSKSILS